MTSTSATQRRARPAAPVWDRCPPVRTMDSGSEHSPPSYKKTPSLAPPPVFPREEFQTPHRKPRPAHGLSPLRLSRRCHHQSNSLISPKITKGAVENAHRGSAPDE